MPQDRPSNAGPEQRQSRTLKCLLDTHQRPGTRYTIGMKLSVFRRRHLLLPGLLLLSLALHLLALAWIDARPTPRVTASGPLAVTLASASVSASRAAPALPTPALPTTAPPATTPAVAASAPAAVAARRRAPAPAPADAALRPIDSAATPQEDSGPPEKASQYRTASHDSVHIAYRMTGADAGSGHLDWRTDGSSYRLAFDGVLGEIASEGGLDDAGIAPRRTAEQLGTGQATTLFDRAAGRIVDGVTGRGAQLVAGSQDDASVLMQLGAIGQADPDQLRSRLAFWIGGVRGARMVYFEMTGEERLETGVGALETVRLVRLPEKGLPQLEVWLAPERAWLPVQLRLTGADGAARTQTVSAISAADPD